MNDVDVYFFNESYSPVTISSNCFIGSILVPKHHAAVLDMNSVLTIAPDSSSESQWMKKVPSAELSRSAYAHRREYVHQVLDIPNSPTLLKNPDITRQLVGLIMIFWNVFYREGIAGEQMRSNIRSIHPKGCCLSDSKIDLSTLA